MLTTCCVYHFSPEVNLALSCTLFLQILIDLQFEITFLLFRKILIKMKQG